MINSQWQNMVLHKFYNAYADISLNKSTVCTGLWYIKNKKANKIFTQVYITISELMAVLIATFYLHSTNIFSHTIYYWKPIGISSLVKGRKTVFFQTQIVYKAPETKKLHFKKMKYEKENALNQNTKRYYLKIV